MLNVKTAEEARNDWEKMVSDKITEEQNKFRTKCRFDFILPEFIIYQLEELGYKVERYGNNTTYVTWEKDT